MKLSLVHDQVVWMSGSPRASLRGRIWSSTAVLLSDSSTSMIWSEMWANRGSLLPLKGLLRCELLSWRQ